MIRLEQVRGEMLERFERVDRRFAQNEQRLGRIDQRLGELADRIDVLLQELLEQLALLTLAPSDAMFDDGFREIREADPAEGADP
jgi:hypothetical protein